MKKQEPVYVPVDERTGEELVKKSRRKAIRQVKPDPTIPPKGEYQKAILAITKREKWANETELRRFRKIEKQINDTLEGQCWREWLYAMIKWAKDRNKSTGRYVIDVGHCMTAIENRESFNIYFHRNKNRVAAAMRSPKSDFSKSLESEISKGQKDTW